MNLAALLRSFLATPTPPDLGPGPRPGVDNLALLTTKLDQALNDTPLPKPRADLARATILLWHDHFEKAHDIAQEIETRDGSYVHAILHRREPDYSNAKYWFQRVGQHACFPLLAARASSFLRASGGLDLERTLIPGGQWDSFAFVDGCEAAAGQPSDGIPSSLLQAIQRFEFEVLLDYLARD